MEDKAGGVSGLDGDFTEAFGVERQASGATTRTTFILANVEVQAGYTGVDPDGHALEVILDMVENGLVDLDW